MYRHSLLGVAALLVSACAADVTNPDPTALLPPQFTHTATTIPYASRCETSFIFTGNPVFTIDAVCQMRGIGRVTGVLVQTLDFSQIAVTGRIGITNHSVYTTPNGDQLHATFAGSGSQSGTDIVFEGVETIAGGTGRFAGASGTAAATGAASVLTSTGHYTTNGTFTR